MVPELVAKLIHNLSQMGSRIYFSKSIADVAIPWPCVTTQSNAQNLHNKIKTLLFSPLVLIHTFSAKKKLFFLFLLCVSLDN